MATILCLETSTTNCSVALCVDGKKISIREEDDRKYSHAENLHVFIEEVLQEADIDKNKLDAIAVGKGPGSYTGLRIGVSAAKGLCFALDVPLISLPTLQILSEQANCGDCFIIPLLDARRMEVYSAVFNSHKKQIRETKAEILSESSFSEYLEKGKTVFMGSGVAKFKTLCSHKNAVFQPDDLPSAANMAQLAETKCKISDTEDVAYFEPYYLKEFMLG